MDAKELTKAYHTQKARISELEKQVRFITDEYEKLRLFVDDLQIDVKMLNHGRQGKWR